MSNSNGNMAEVGQQNLTTMIPIMEVITVDDFTFGYENGEAYILFQKNMQPKTLMKLSPNMAYKLGQTLLHSAPVALPDAPVDSFSTNGSGEPMKVKAVESENTSDDSERRAELYERLKGHPLEGVIGFFDECDVEDASTNVHKYISEYHAERHARLSN